MPTPHATVVLVTTANEEEAEHLARVLLDQHLIACANIVPHVRSFFRWEGQVECAEESLLVIKTTSEALPSLTETVKREHSYEVPEIVALPVAGGSAEYLSWIATEVRPAADADGG
jgi:periplasmic divalent cation tolerance protein